MIYIKREVFYKNSVYSLYNTHREVKGDIISYDSYLHDLFYYYEKYDIYPGCKETFIFSEIDKPGNFVPFKLYEIKE